MIRKRVTVDGKRCVMIEERELKRLERLAEKATGVEGAKRSAGDRGKRPAYPAADAKGNRPAVEFARVSIARSIVKARRAAGLSQQELAKLAGIRQETISRIESGKHSPTVRTVEKIERALEQAAKKR